MLECKIDPDRRSRRCSQRHSFTLPYLSLSLLKLFITIVILGMMMMAILQIPANLLSYFFLNTTFPNPVLLAISFCFSLFFVLLVIVALLSSNFQNNNQLFNVNPPYKLQKSEIKKIVLKKLKVARKQ